jgi:tRNA U54 and U55 pseudouridine synthase Pus10
MENSTSTTTDSSKTLGNNFCEGCHFIFKNINLINTQNEISDTVKAYLEKTTVNLDEDKICKFCGGILNHKNFVKIYDQVKKEIVKYDHKDYKITTNFSPVYSLLHAYVKIYLF